VSLTREPMSWKVLPSHEEGAVYERCYSHEGVFCPGPRGTVSFIAAAYADLGEKSLLREEKVVTCHSRGGGGLFLERGRTH